MLTELSERAWPTIGRAPLVLVPAGSTEQHGPHLPFDTDTVIARAVTEAVARRLEDDVVVAPAISYGSSGEHQGFPGTMSIGQDALYSTLVELTRSLSTWAGRIVFVNAHGGNLAPLERAITQMIDEHHDVAWLPCAVVGADAHAGRTETSLMLHLTPAVVAIDRAQPGHPGSYASLAPQLAEGGVIAVSPNGILGDPTGASASEGADILERMVSGALRRLTANRRDHRGCLSDPGAA